ncbi:MAG TPA: MMPL family transporter [Myxococcota bacterium]|nr:MMPL family transporter [Myxococcota bacterium]
MDALMLRFSRFFIKHRLVNLILIGGATIFFAYHALQLQVFSQFIDLLPRNHPFIQIYEKYNRQFGSANVVYAAIVAKNGTVYDERVLEKVYAFTDQIDKVEGVDHGQVVSMTAVTVRDTAIDQSGIIKSTQVVGEEPIALLEAQFFTRRTVARAKARGDTAPGELGAFKEFIKARKGVLEQQIRPDSDLSKQAESIPKKAAELSEVRRENAELEFLQLRLNELPDTYKLQGENLIGPDGTLLPKAVTASLPDRIHQNKQVYGRFVSLDDTSAMVTAGFLESRLDYQKIFTEIHALKDELEKDGLVTVHLTGQPILVGWTFFYKWEIVLILALSLGILLAMLGIYFRRWYGVVMPFSGAICCTIWGLGFTSLMGYQIEPLVLVIPMVITARAISHSVQFVERFYEEYERLNGDKMEAVVLSMAELLIPGFLGIVADAIGIIVIGVSSIALMKKVAIFGAFWSIAIIFTEMLLNRLMIAYFPAPKDTSHYVPGPIMSVLKRIAYITTNPTWQRGIIGVWVVIIVLCATVATRVKIGESHPGTPVLWPNSEFNQSAAVVASKFYGADDLVVVVETEQQGAVHKPEAMHEIEAFQRYMEQDPKVGGTVSVVDYLKAINRAYHNSDPRWSSIPYSTDQIGGLLYLYEAGSPDPRVLNPYRDQEAQNATVRVFYKDHQAETIHNAVVRAEEYIFARPTGRYAIRLETPRHDLQARVRWWLGPLVPPRNPDLVVLARDDKGVYQKQEVTHPARREPPPEDSKDRILTLPRTSKELVQSLSENGYDNVQKIASADLKKLSTVPGFDLVTAYALKKAAQLDRRYYRVDSEWQDDQAGIRAQVRRRGLYELPELWVKYQNNDFVRRESGQWAEGPSFALASGLMGVLGASNDEVEGSNNATLIASFTAIFLVIILTYRSFAVAFLLCLSLGTATLVSLAYMYFANIGFDVNTLPVQALGVGVGVDYGLYLMDRIIHERRRGHNLDEAIRVAITTTGMAVFFTGSTLVGGIIFWYFISSLRFAADMSLLMSIVLGANMVGAMVLVPAMTSMFKPGFASDVAVPEMHERKHPTQQHAPS